ncbi:MAG TPA: hypothetical protein VG963_08270 [Polyangiaceae bacterium]|nr:hypothetical protein [Polyangiaceae bacterium]
MPLAHRAEVRARGLTRSSVGKLLWRRAVTTRNWNTVQKLAEMLEG